MRWNPYLQSLLNQDNLMGTQAHYRAFMRLFTVQGLKSLQSCHDPVIILGDMIHNPSNNNSIINYYNSQ